MQVKDAYTVQEIACILGISRQAVAKRAKNEAWEHAPREGRGGGNEWLIASLPDATRCEIQARLAAQLTDSASTQLAANAPTTIPPTTAPDIVIPDWALDIAKARYRIVTEWRAHCARQAHSTKAVATESFIAAYNAGLLLSQLQQHISEISMPTLYRWDATLRAHHDDMLVLADRRGKWRVGGPKGLGQLGEKPESLFLKLYLHGNKPTMQMAYRALETALTARQLPVPSYSSTRRFFERFDAAHHDIVVFMREGEKAYIDKVGGYLSRNDKILRVGDVLIADGHKMNFMVINPNTGKPCRFTLIGWEDWASRMFMGFEIMLEENTQAISVSLHRSILALGRMPSCAYIDNGKAFKNKYFSENADLEELDGLYLRLGIHVQHSMPYMARTKIIERWWLDFDQQCARALESYTGNCINNKPARLQRNEKWHQQHNSGYVPTIADVQHMVVGFAKWKALQPHPTRPHTTPWEVFSAERGEGLTQEQSADLARNFMHRRAITPSRCRFTMMGVIFESDELHGINKQLTAHYAYADLSEVYVYDAGRLVTIARPVESVNPLASVFGDALDVQAVKDGNKRIAKLRNTTRKMATELSAASAESLMSLPHMQGVAERRAPIMVQRPLGQELPASPELSDGERTKLESVISSHALAIKAKPSYESPAFFGSELERYDFLFKIRTEQGLPLKAEDAAFTARYEQSQEYITTTGRRYEQLRRLYPNLMPLEATA
ncbi:MAG: DNA-binding domain-containing protein [Desulfovibrionaceae bacterium]